MQMAETFKFPTGSQYTGSYNGALHSMEGFGRYTFPDGSEYRGFFQRGKFHGFGRLLMGMPNKFTFTCEYHEGKLMRITSMQFPDGLLLTATINGDHLNYDDWLYCTAADRRFSNEIAIGIEPVGPTANLTATRPERVLPPGTYDTGGGIFKSSTRFIIGIHPPFFRHKFVGCDKEADWIRANCRRGQSMDAKQGPVEPDLAVAQHIINMNIDGLRSVDPCSCRESASRKGYLAKLCGVEKRRYKSDKSSELSGHSTHYMSKPSTESASSFGEVSLIEEIQEKCELEVQGLKINMCSISDMGDSSLMDAERKASLIAKSNSRSIDPSYKPMWDN